MTESLDLKQVEQPEDSDSSASSGRRQLRDGTVLLIATGITALATFGFMTIAGQRLGPAESSDLFAGIFLLFAVHTLASPVSTAVARAVAVALATGDRAAAGAVTDRVFGLSGKAAAALGAIAVVSVPWQAEFLGVQPGVLAPAWLAALLLACATVVRGAMRGVQDFPALAANMVAEALVRVAVGIGVLYWLGRPDVAMAAYLVGVAVIWPHLASWRRRTFANSQRQPVTDDAWLPFAGPLLLLAVADAGFQNYDVLYIKRAASAADAGAYGAAATLSRALGVLVTPFVLQVVPLLADLAARRKATNGTLVRLILPYVVLSAAAIVLLAGWGSELLGGLFGEGFARASEVLVPHALGALAGYTAMVLAQGLIAVGRVQIAWLYLVLFGAEVVALPLAGQTLVRVAMTLLVIKSVVLAVTLLAWWMHRPATQFEAGR